MALPTQKPINPDATDKELIAEVLQEAETQPAETQPAETQPLEAVEHTAVDRSGGQVTDMVDPHGGSLVQRDTTMPLAQVNPETFLKEQGFTDDLKLDFTSFPTVKLEDEKFHTSEYKGFCTEFNCQIMGERKQHVYMADLGRDKDPEIVYSDDGVHQNGEGGAALADIFQEWKKNNYPYDHKVYKIVMARFISGGNGELDDEIVQLQIPPTSIGKFDGYLWGLGAKRPPVSPRDAVTRVSVGTKVGTGMKAFNPFHFKFMGLLD